MSNTAQTIINYDIGSITDWITAIGTMALALVSIYAIWVAPKWFKTSTDEFSFERIKHFTNDLNESVYELDSSYWDCRRMSDLIMGINHHYSGTGENASRIFHIKEMHHHTTIGMNSHHNVLDKLENELAAIKQMGITVHQEVLINEIIRLSRRLYVIWLAAYKPIFMYEFRYSDIDSTYDERVAFDSVIAQYSSDVNHLEATLTQIKEKLKQLNNIKFNEIFSAPDKKRWLSRNTASSKSQEAAVER